MARPVSTAPATLRTRGVLAAVAATLVLLAGCSTGGEADAGASGSPSGSASAEVSARPDPDAPLDANQACAAMYVKGDKTLEERIGTALVGASEDFDATDADQMHALALELGRLESRVPEEFQGPVKKVRAPFLQLQQGLDAEAGKKIDLDVASTVEGLKEFKELC